MALPSPTDFAAYGGALINHHPIANPQTDRDAKAVNSALSDLAMMTRMCPRAWCQFNASNAPSVVDHDATWGKVTPVVAPTVSRTSAGIFVLTWPASVIDNLGEIRAVNFRWGSGSVADSTAKRPPQVKRTSANVATVYTYDAAGTAADINALVDVEMR